MVSRMFRSMPACAGIAMRGVDVEVEDASIHRRVNGNSWEALAVKQLVPRDGVEPPTPAFSGLAKAAKSVISSNPREYKGALGNAQGRLLFPYCSRAGKRRIS